MQWTACKTCQLARSVYLGPLLDRALPRSPQTVRTIMCLPGPNMLDNHNLILRWLRSCCVSLLKSMNCARAITRGAPASAFRNPAPKSAERSKHDIVLRVPDQPQSQITSK